MAYICSCRTVDKTKDKKWTTVSIKTNDVMSAAAAVRSARSFDTLRSDTAAKSPYMGGT
jgi:hypothetical protein